jgi:hypothetical protein
LCDAALPNQLKIDAKNINAYYCNFLRWFFFYPNDSKDNEIRENLIEI